MRTEQEKEDDELLFRLFWRVVYWTLVGAAWLAASATFMWAFFTALSWLTVHAPWVSSLMGWLLVASLAIPLIGAIALAIYFRIVKRKREKK